MIRSKQMEEIRGLDKRLRALGTVTPPSLEKHVMIALVNGEAPKLQPIAKIARKAREKIITDRYSRSLGFGDVFASCNGYDAEMKIFDAHEKKRKAALARYEKQAEKILVQALDQEADAAEIIEQLHDAAQESGLNDITAPTFGDTADTD